MNEALSAGNIAVITGAASGIGRAVAVKLAGMGMRIAMVDANADKLPDAQSEVIAATNGDNTERTVTFNIDVSDRVAMQTVADRVLRDWGTPHFLMNNAAIGVHGGGDGSIMDSVDNWRRVFDVNLFGYLNGVAAFLPAMLEAGQKAFIVNTGSKQGITMPPGNPAYNTVKSAVNSYTMSLAHDLRNRGGGNVSAHLLVPGWTTTGDNEHKDGAWLPEQVADYLIEHLLAGDFYIICPDNETSSETDKKRFRWQAEDMIENRPALSRWHDDYKDAFAEYMKKPLS